MLPFFIGRGSRSKKAINLHIDPDIPNIKLSYCVSRKKKQYEKFGEIALLRCCENAGSGEWASAAALVQSLLNIAGRGPCDGWLDGRVTSP